MILSTLALLFAFAAPLKELSVEEDLMPLWKILDDGKFHNYDGRYTKSIYLSIELNKDESHFLQVQSPDEFYLFINYTLISRNRHLKLRADSLEKQFGRKIIVSIYQDKGIRQLSTAWMVYKTKNLYENPPRPTRSFSNFIMVSTLVLIIFFTALLRNNPQLTLDYLNVVKLFSFKRRDDSQFVLRITSSVNLVFYFFCSLLTSLALMVALHFSEFFFLTIPMKYESASGYIAQWFFLSILMAGLLLLKLGLAYMISMLFGWRDTAGFQFFNFVRLLVISLMLIGGLSIFCFSLNININYYFLVKCFCFMLALGSVFMFFKLLNRESTGAFHLFSYLCATEIFPLLILIKVFLF